MFVWFALGLLWFLSIVPAIVIAFEFGAGNLEYCGNEAYYYARFYSPFFLYPWTFGLLSTLFLVRPLRQVIVNLLGLPLKRRWKMGAGCAALMVLIIGYACFTEFDGSTSAIWEFSPTALDTDTGKSARSILESRCKANAYHETRTVFKQHLEDLRNERTEVSLTGMAYYVGFFALAVLFTVLLMTIILTFVLRVDALNIHRFLLVALLSTSVWVLCRISFMGEKLTLFGSDPLFPHNMAIFGLFGFLYFVLAISAWNVSSWWARTIDIFTSVGGITATVFSLFHQEAVLRSLMTMFGSGATANHYMLIFVVWTILVSPILLLWLRGPDHEDGGEHHGGP